MCSCRFSVSWEEVSSGASYVAILDWNAIFKKKWVFTPILLFLLIKVSNGYELFSDHYFKYIHCFHYPLSP